VVGYTLRYSEGNMTYGASSETATATKALTKTIKLTSPVGAATTRYFTTSQDVAAADWVYTGGVTLTQVTANRTYGVVIPEGFEGTATLTVEDFYTVTFDVAPRAESSSLERGDTFQASGIEWRVLYKQSSADVLILAEHVLIGSQQFNSIAYWDDTENIWGFGYIGWSNCDMYNALQGNVYNFSYGNLESGFRGKILDTSLYTRKGATDARFKGYILSNQKMFLLSQEEVFRSIVYGTVTTNQYMDLSKNIYGGVVLFPDNVSRRATPINNVNMGGYTTYTLRSPSGGDTARCAGVYMNTGGTFNDGIASNYSHGIRPALRINPGN
jgi:hypothetical protein